MRRTSLMILIWVTIGVAIVSIDAAVSTKRKVLRGGVLNGITPNTTILFIELDKPSSTDQTSTPVVALRRKVMKGTKIIGNRTTSSPHRIVGGQAISISQAPWQVALILDRELTCGGSILSSIWVLTAAHCVDGIGSGRFLVRAGSDFFRSGGQLRRVASITRHAAYNSATDTNDIAMLRIQGTGFTLGTNVQAVRIPGASSSIPSTLYVSGWGTLSESTTSVPRQLRAAALNYVPNYECNRLYGTVATITDSMVCASASGRDSCQGDSGGALVNNGIQYGIISFGVGCARAQYPGVNTKVQKYRNWIAAVAKSSGSVQVLNNN